MINDYVIACGVTRHDIFLSNPKDCDEAPVPVTAMCVTAVRDYMVDSIKDSPVGYSWKRGDGKIVKLICSVEDGA